MQRLSVVQSSATIFSSPPVSSVTQQNIHMVRNSKSQVAIYHLFLHGLQSQGAYSNSGHCPSEPQASRLTAQLNHRVTGAAKPPSNQASSGLLPDS